MNKTNFWKLALALIVGLALSTLVFAQEGEVDDTLDSNPPLPVDNVVEEGAPEQPESANGGFEFTIPNVFADGNVLTAAQLNQNFNALGNGIDTKLNISGNNSNPTGTFSIAGYNFNELLNYSKNIYLDRDANSTSAALNVRRGTASALLFRVTQNGDVLVGRDLTVTDDVTINDILTVNNDASIGDNLTVTDDITMGNNLVCNGADCDIFLQGTNPVLQVNPAGSADNANTIRADIRGRTKTMTLQITGGSDLAEPFNIAASPTVSPMPGMVVSIDPNQAGELMVATDAFDTRVAGIISGAGGVNPGMIMTQVGAGLEGPGSLPVALTGKVWTWVDASYGAIQAGDLLTTSATHGHAMKVADPSMASGAMIGKAMTSLDEGTGLVLVLISMQ